MQIDFRSQNINVAHVSREPRQSRMDIKFFAVPVGEPMNGEGVAPVIRTWADPTAGGLQAFLSEQLRDRVTGTLERQRLPITAKE